mgnify:CR=1 FL=1
MYHDPDQINAKFVSWYGISTVDLRVHVVT